jgi:hypothetical protein
MPACTLKTFKKTNLFLLEKLVCQLSNTDTLVHIEHTHSQLQLTLGQYSC